MTQGICKTCGCVCVLDEMWERYGCPACRAARVAEAFRPIDPLRTAMGIPGSFQVKGGNIVPLDREEMRKELREALVEKGILWHESKGFYRPEAESDHPTMELSDDESGHRLARTLDADDAAQIYELRRLFRLYEPR